MNRLIALGIALVILTGCGNSSPKVKEKVTPANTKCVAIPSAVRGTWLPKMLSPVPTVTGPGVKEFGTECAQTAFIYAFSFLYRINKIPDLWTPNMNKDPNFIPKLEKELRAFAPYLGGKFKQEFLDAIPYMFNSESKGNDEKVGSWRGIMLLPQRLANGTLPPTSKKADDLEAVAPWDLGASVSVPIANSGTLPEFKDRRLLELKFTWSSNMVFGTRTRIKNFYPLKREITVVLMANPDSGKGKQHPYLIVLINLDELPVFGKMVEYNKPLIERAPQ